MISLLQDATGETFELYFQVVHSDKKRHSWSFESGDRRGIYHHRFLNDSRL